ncbi:MAG TPA: DinB family protein [Candidatus Limnocylindria bacterium]|nr:DinB family protein [Candidatus Limnocylindria bacterium]
MLWVNRRLLDAAARLTDEVWQADDHVTTRGLRATLVHELDVEWSWRLALEGRPEEEWGEDKELRAEDFPTVASLRERWAAESSALRDWVGSLSDDDLVESTQPGLSSRALPRWMFVQHLVSHGAQQAADAATLLTADGESPGDIGFLEYIGETHGRRP